MTTLTDLKLAHRATWASGDYPAVAERIDAVPPLDLLDRLTITPGQDVLDVATGTGNVALRAAAAGARVVGLDLTPELFVAARREAEYRATVEWIAGDAEEPPFNDGCFDHVLSVFGVQVGTLGDFTYYGGAQGVQLGAVSGLADVRLVSKLVVPLPTTTPHSLRRTYISVALLATGFDVLFVMSRSATPTPR